MTFPPLASADSFMEKVISFLRRTWQKYLYPVLMTPCLIRQKLFDLNPTENLTSVAKRKMSDTRNNEAVAIKAAWASWSVSRRTDARSISKRSSGQISSTYTVQYIVRLFRKPKCKQKKKKTKYKSFFCFNLNHLLGQYLHFLRILIWVFISVVI